MRKRTAFEEGVTGNIPTRAGIGQEGLEDIGLINAHDE
jgi:hypothetical protein